MLRRVPLAVDGPSRSELTAQELLYRLRWPIAAGAVLLLVVGLVAASLVATRPAPAARLDPAAGERPPLAAPVSQETVILGQAVRLVVPPTGEIAHVAILFPSEGRGVEAIDDAWLQPLLAAGWAIATSDFHGDGWGAPTTSGDARGLVNWAQSTARAPVSMFIGDSMGTLDSLSALIRGRVAIPCWYGVEPIADLRLAGRDPALATAITTAYGGVPSWSESPINQAERLPVAASYRIVAATDDVPVPWRGADDLVAALTAGGRTVTTAALPVARGDASLHDGADLAAFAGGCA